MQNIIWIATIQWVNDGDGTYATIIGSETVLVSSPHSEAAEKKVYAAEDALQERDDHIVIASVTLRPFGGSPDQMADFQWLPGDEPYSGSFCPFCKSTDIVGDSPEVLDECVVRGEECNDCGRSWRENYELTGIITDDGDVVQNVEGENFKDDEDE